MRGYEDSKVPRLFELMEMRKIKATQLSRETGIATGSITDWKRGKSIPTGSRLVTLCRYFNVTAAELLGIEVAPEIEEMVSHMEHDIPAKIVVDDEFLKKVVETVSELPEDQHKELMDYIQYLKYKNVAN